MITLTSSDPTPDLLPLQTHFPIIGYPMGRKDISGAGVTVVMIGSRWNQDHEALFHNPNIVYPPVPPWENDDPQHDTAVLSILGGVLGIQGMCPNASIRPMYFGMLRETLIAAQVMLKAGDVILLERVEPSSTAEVPAELLDEVFDETKACTDAGIIVVQPGGNTNTDLDHLRFMEKFDRAQRDSGAIFVAAAFCRDGYIGPAGFTNYGSRIDVCAPGVGIMGAGFGTYVGGENKNRWYAQVKGTSYAAAIVAGACAGISSARLKAGLPPLTALEMRSLLVASGTETDRSKLPGIQIGKMLNVRSALAYAVPSADFDGDGKVGLKDFWMLATAFGGTDGRFDLDGDGRVSLLDFWKFKEAWGP